MLGASVSDHSGARTEPCCAAHETGDGRTQLQASERSLTESAACEHSCR